MASAHRIARRLLSPSSSLAAVSRQAPRQQLLHPRIPARHASTSAASAATDSLPISRVKIALYATSIAASGFALYVYATDTRAFPHRYIVPRLLRLVFPDAEDAHDVSVASLKSLYPLNLHPRERAPLTSPSCSSDPDLSTTVFGVRLANPVGISAGLDKHAEIPDALFALGAAVVEVGGVTPLPQPGNPRPRMFRVPGLDGLVNRYGLNSRGADAMAARLRERARRFALSLGLNPSNPNIEEAGVPTGSLSPGRLLLVQIAKNKDTDERDVDAVARDYVYCVRRLAPYADVLVVNVSSPNTPGLRDLQAAGPLARILGAVVEEAARCTERGVRPRVMVKVSPDEDEDAQIEGVVQAVWSSGVDGVIVGNTTKRRTGLVPKGVKLTAKEQRALTETGGYSGPMMFERTADLVRRYRTMLDGQALHLAADGAAVAQAKEEAVDASIAAIDGTITGLPEDKPPAGASRAPVERKVIFATGGISNGRQALEVLNAGASVAMVYTGLVYGGAGTITRMKGEMKREIAESKK
ncbi:FMN-linked oxidoreductase [Whalleya microplaca]|nr:FMN-linked oxidoreductase [Whalleya microplaca]